jgi:hypothetical protein
VAVVDVLASAAAEGSCGPKSSSELLSESSALSLLSLSCSGWGNVGPIVRCLFSGDGGGLRLRFRELVVSGAGAGAGLGPGGRAGPGEEELSDMMSCF